MCPIHPLGRDLEHIGMTVDILPVALFVWLGRTKHLDKGRRADRLPQAVRVGEESRPDTLQHVAFGLPCPARNQRATRLDVEVVSGPDSPTA